MGSSAAWLEKRFREVLDFLEPIQIAVVGAGYWGKKVIREIFDISRTTGLVELRSIVDNSPTTLEQCRREFGDLDYRLDYRSLLSDTHLSAVHICSPNSTHFQVASDFIKHGKGVLVEKPLAVKSGEAYELVQLAHEDRTVLCTGHIHRFNNGVRELRKAMNSGLLGELYYLRLRWTDFLPPQTQREVITDLAPHPLDICNYLLGSWPVKITCRGKGYRTRENEEVALLVAEYADGLCVYIEVSWLDQEKHRDVTAVGSGGMVSLDCSEQRAILKRRGETEEVPVTPSNTLRVEIVHFLECIRHNQLSESFSNLSDGVLGANVVAVLEAARESLHQDRTVHVQFPIVKGVLVS